MTARDKQTLTRIFAVVIFCIIVLTLALNVNASVEDGATSGDLVANEVEQELLAEQVAEPYEYDGPSSEFIPASYDIGTPSNNDEPDVSGMLPEDFTIDLFLCLGVISGIALVLCMSSAFKVAT